MLAVPPTGGAMMPSSRTADELRTRTLELRADRLRLTREIEREDDPSQIRLLARVWHAVTRAEVAMLDELAARGESSP